MIAARRGINIMLYPGVMAHLSNYRDRLEPRQPGQRGSLGRKPGNYEWYELQDAMDFYAEFDKPKIFYQEIQFHPAYAFDDVRLYGNNKTSFVCSGDLYLLAVLNSPLMWWHNWRYLPHMKDEALSPNGYLVAALPIAQPSERIRCGAEASVRQLISITRTAQDTRKAILDWLRVQHDIEKPSMKLRAPVELDCDGLVAEVKKVRGKKKPLSAAALKNLRDEHAQTVEPARALAAEALNLENEVSNLVNEAYGLTPEEIALMWKTAPPRMPIAEPQLPDTSQ